MVRPLPDVPSRARAGRMPYSIPFFGGWQASVAKW